MCTGAPQGGVEVRRRYDSPGLTGRTRPLGWAHHAAPPRRRRPHADTNCRRPIGNGSRRECCSSAPANELRRHLGPTVQGKHLLHLQPIDRHGLHRKTKRFATGGQHHLGETCCGHDGLAVHLVVCQPRYDLGSDVSPATHGPGRKASRRAPPARGEHRSTARPAGRFATQYLECSHGVGGISASRSALPADCAVSSDGGRTVGQLRMEGERFGVVTIHRCRHVDITARSGRLQALADGVGEQRVRADFDEGRVVGAGGGHGLAEPHRVAQIGHPVVGIETSAPPPTVCHRSC